MIFKLLLNIVLFKECISPREINFYESKILLKDVVNNDHLNYSYLHFHPSIDIEVRKILS